MEYRWHLRKPLRLDVVLYYRGTRLLQCRAEDISQQGMFLKTGPAFFAKNVPVEVEFALEDAEGKAQTYHLRAVVVHGESDGIGVMFRDFDRTLVDALRREHTGVLPPAGARVQPPARRAVG